MKTSRAKGFTLIETMLALMIGGLLLGLAIPNMIQFSRNNRLSSGSNDILRSLQVARVEAIKRQLVVPQSIILCASTAPLNAAPTCGGAGTPFRGWFSFHDANGDWQYNAGETLVEQHDLMDVALNVRTSNGSIVSFTVTGFVTPSGPAGQVPTDTIILCDARGNTAIGTTDSTARALMIDRTGRSHVTRTKSVITDLITANAALACP